MCARFSGVSRGTRTMSPTCVHCCSRFSPARDTDQGVETCVQVSRESHPSGTDGDRKESCGSLVKAQASARVFVPNAPPFFVVLTKESHTCVQVVFTIMLGSAHDGQPTMILQVSFQMRKKEREKEKEKEKERERRCKSVIIL